MRKGIIIIIFLFSFVLLCAQAPEWQWAVSAGGESRDAAYDMTIDQDNNLYVVGFFYSIVAEFGDFSLVNVSLPDPIEPELQLMNDIFIAKMDNDGNWLWARQAGGPSYDHGSGIAVDSYGNVYVTGAFADSASFGNTTLYSQTSSVFISKLDTNGNWCWTVQANGTDYSKGADIEIDNNDNIYVTGAYWSIIQFDDITLTSSGDADVFIAKLDTNGNWTWALNISLSDVYWEDEFRLASDTNNNLYLTGGFSDTVTFASTLLTSIGNSDVFIAKMDSNGNWLWAQQAGGLNSDSGYGITTDFNNNVIVTGFFSETATFGSTGLTSNGQIDIFISKLDSNGNWIWAKRAGGNETHWESGWGITTDQNNDVYFTGCFSGNADFGSTNLINIGTISVFVAKLDANGNWLWAKRAGQTYDFGIGIVIDNDNNIYHTGSFFYDADFGNIILEGPIDVFVAKLSPPRLNLLSPNGGEVWRNNTNKTIYWSANYQGDIDILFSYNYGSTWSYLNSAPVSSMAGSFTFTVPSIPSGQCLIKVASVNDPGSVFDISDATFTITTSATPSVTLLSPDSINLKLQSGRGCTITWQSYMVSNVNIDISYNGGITWHNIVSDLPAINESYNWIVSDSVSTTCYFRVSSSQYPHVYDWSNNLFSIVTLELLSPNGGEEIQLFRDHIVSWQSDGIDNIRLEYSSDNGQNWITLANSYPTVSGVYQWNIDTVLGSQNLFKITDVENQNIFDVSDDLFTVCSIQLLTPDGDNIRMQAGKSITISWSSNYVSSLLKLEFSTDNGESFGLIADSIQPGVSTYDWTVPDINSTECRFKISSIAYPDVHSLIGNYTICKLNLTTPNGGEIWASNSYQDIAWNSYNIQYLSIAFSSDNGENWTSIVSSAEASSGSFNWQIPNIFSEECLIRITDQADGNISDFSAGSFSIYPALRLLAPNGGEYMTANTLYTIRWNALPEIQAVLLDYSLDNASTWQQIFSTPYPATNGQYEWIVPNTTSNQALIRIRKSDNPSLFDVSDSTFTIVDVVIAPTADFTADLISGLEPLEVQFTDMSEAGSGYITSWLWDFGDGDTSTEQNPLHTYVNHGLYSVSLTVTNVFDSTGTIVKTDYINVFPREPVIEILSDSPVNFGFVYLGSQSVAQSVWISDTGTAPLIIDSISFYQGIHFENDNTEFPIIVNEGDSTSISLIFTPMSAGMLSDSLYIHNNSQNQPTAAIKLSGTSAYVPPKPPENVSVAIDTNDAIISWDAVTETIFDTPIVPDGYIILYNETPYEDEQYYYYLGYTTSELTYTHLGVALFRNQMFYKVIAFVNYERDILARLDELNRAGTKVRYKDLIKK